MILLRPSLCLLIAMVMCQQYLNIRVHLKCVELDGKTNTKYNIYKYKSAEEILQIIIEHLVLLAFIYMEIQVHIEDSIISEMVRIGCSCN